MVLVFFVNVKPVEESQLPVTVKVPVPVRVPLNIVLVTLMLVPVVEIVPVIVRLLKLLLELRKFTVLVVPESVTVEVLFVNVLPAPLVSQLPLAFHAPAPLKLMVPLVPPVIVTSMELTVPLVMLNVVPLPTV